MNIIKTTLYEKVLYPLYQIKYGPVFGHKIIKTFKHLNETQWLSQQAVLEYQSKKLRRLIKHVYHNVPFYHKIMNKVGLKPEDIRHIEDLKYLPILTKKQIKENYDEIISVDIKRRNAVEASTGGSTGEPLIFFRDIETRIWTEAALLRGRSWAHYKLGDTLIHFGSPHWPSIFGKLRIKLMNIYSFPAFAKKDELLRYFQEIKMLHPYCLTGLSSNLYRIATVCHENKIDSIQFPVIFSTAEMLYDYQREFLERQFSSKVFDYYGCNEIGSLAYECEYKNKHISNEHVIIETTDSNGVSVIDKLGEITITDLDNYAMPFIRYKNGDVGIVTNRNCNCKRGLSLLKSLEGRAQAFLKTLDGNYVPAIFFPTRFRNLKGIEEYQIIQTDIYNIIFKIVKNAFFCEKELTEMVYAIREIIGKEVNIKVEECKHIPLTGRGKTRLVISHLSPEF